MPPLPPSVGLRVYWLVELTIGGRRLRYADAELGGEIPGPIDQDGREIPFAGGLLEDLSITLAATPYSTEAPAAEVQLVILPDVDLAALAAQGHRIGGAAGEVSRWVEGTAYEERRVVLVGRLVDPEYGGDGDELTATLADNVWEDRNLTGTPTQRVDGHTWDYADSLAVQHLGLQYPIVIGRPGRVDTATSADGWIPATKALWVDHRSTPVGAGNLAELLLVVAGHHVRCRRVQAYVEGEPGASTRLAVVNGWDARGQPVAYIPWYVERDGVLWTDAGAWSDPYEYDAGAGYDYGAADGTNGLGLSGIDAGFVGDGQAQVYIAWYDDIDGDAESGGVELGGEVLRSAPDVLGYLLGLTSVAVDRGRIAAELAPLRDYAIDAVIEERTSVWTWISTYLLPILPIALCSGPRGLYLRVWSESAPVVADIDLDAADSETVDRLTEDTSDGYSQVAVSFNRNALSGQLVSVVTAGAAMDRPTEATAREYQVSPACDALRAAGAALSVREVDAPVLYGLDTAWRVALGLARELGHTRILHCRIPEARHRQIDLWSVVRVTCSRFSLSAARCRVEELTVDGSGFLSLTLRLL